MEILEKVFKSDFMPHGHCYFWRSEIVWTNAISDGIIALAYLTIPFTLVYIIKARKDINFMSLVLLFAVFILGCGATHVMDVINIWKPYYYIDSSLRVITALASIGTAIMPIKITPQILVIPNPQKFKKLNENLVEQLRQLEEKEKEIREREALLLETQEIGNIGSFDLDVKTWKYQWTPQMFRIFGYEQHEKIDREKIFARIHPEDKEKVKVSIQKAYDNIEQINLEYRLLLPDNSIKYIWTRGMVHFNEERQPSRLVGTVIDLTEEKEAERQLEAAKNELSEVKEFVFLAESVPQLVWTTKPDGGVDYFNQNWYKYTGQSLEEAKEWGWIPVIHPDDAQRTTETWSTCIEDEIQYQIEYRLRKFDGSYRWFLGKGVPMKDELGKTIKWFGTCTDIHDLKSFEQTLIRKNEELTKINKDLDNFVYTAWHDLKGPVTNLEGLITMFKKKVSPKIQEDERQVLGLMENSVGRFKNTILELTEITKINKSINEDVQLVFFENILEEIKEDLSNQLEETTANFKIDFQIPSIYFSKINFKSILHNLLSNAVKYGSPERAPVIQIKTFKEGNYCVLSIRDNGLGFDITKKEKVFSMFRRLHNHVEGTGLGLYIVKRIIEDAGGKIEVESVINQGSEFKIYFPY